MKHLVFCAFLLWAGWASAAVAYVGSTGNQTDSSTTLTLSYNCTGGNALFLFEGHVTYTLNSVADTLGHTWIHVTDAYQAGTATVYSSVYYVPVCTGGSNTITLTYSNSGARPNAAVLEYSGISPHPFDINATGCQTCTTIVTSQNSAASGLQIAWAFDEYDGSGPGTDTYSATGFTSRQRVINSNAGVMGVLDNTSTSAGTSSITTTTSTSARTMAGGVISVASSAATGYVGAHIGLSDSSGTTVSAMRYCTAGDIEAMFVGTYTTGTGSTPTIADTLGQTWNLVSYTATISSNTGAWYVQSCSGGIGTVTLTWSATASMPVLEIAEYHSLGSVTLAASSFASCAGCTTKATGSVTTTSGTTTLIGFGYNTDDTHAPGQDTYSATSFTSRARVGQIPQTWITGTQKGVFQVLDYSTTAGTYNPSIVTSASSTSIYFVGVLAFSTSAGSTVQPFQSIMTQNWLEDVIPELSAEAW